MPHTPLHCYSAGFVCLFVCLFFLFFPILQCNQTCNHPQEDLAGFGYRRDMKVKILRILLYFGYLLEPVVEIW
jgi:hypothetical protein